jgi:Tfp pilus assembly protein PilF
VLEKAIRQDPQYAYAHNNMGNVYTSLGNHDEAIKAYRLALNLLPDAPDINNNLGAALCKQARYEEGVAILHETIRKYPRFFDAYLNLAEAAITLGEMDDAINILHEAARLGPDNDEVYGKLAKSYFTKTEYLAARSAASTAIKINPKAADHYFWLGRTLHEMNLPDDAEAMLSKAVTMQPDNAEFHNSLGETLKKKKAIQLAARSFERALELDPENVNGHTHLALLIKHDSYDKIMQSMEQLLKNKDLPDEERISLYTSLGKSFNDLCDYETAFKYTSKGNDLRKGISPYDINRRKSDIREMLDIFTSTRLNQQKDSGYPDCKPVFITGMPRSGKTVVENILALHPLITAGGESADFIQACNGALKEETRATFPEGIRDADSELSRGVGIEYDRLLKQRFRKTTIITNTQPFNSDYIGMIRMCLPGAKVILCRRNARDNCLEMFRKGFTRGHLYSFDPDVLREYFLLQTDFMNQWLKRLPEFIHVVQFENFIQNPRDEIRSLLEFCDLPWNDACLDIDSLPSPEQVIGVWKNYEEYLKQLFDKLDS